MPKFIVGDRVRNSSGLRGIVVEGAIPEDDQEHIISINTTYIVQWDNDDLPCVHWEKDLIAVSPLVLLAEASEPEESE